MKTYYNKNDLGKSFGLAVGAMLLLQLALSLVFARFYNAETGQFADWAYWTLQTIYALGLGSMSIVYAKITKTNMLTACKVQQKPPLAHIGWGCLATLFLVCCMLPINEWFLDLFELIGLKRPTTDMPMNLPTNVLLPLMLFVVCVIPAVTEEFLFRGTISASVEGKTNKLAALSICGALFALFHLSAAQTVHQFVLGAFLALLFFRSGSIWTTVCVHFFNNLLAVTLMFTVNENIFVGKYGWVFALVGAVGFAGSVVGYLFTTKSKWGRKVTAKADQTAADDEENGITELQQEKTTVKSIVLLVGAIAVCLTLWILGLFA